MTSRGAAAQWCALMLEYSCGLSIERRSSQMLTPVGFGSLWTRFEVLLEADAPKQTSFMSLDLFVYALGIPGDHVALLGERPSYPVDRRAHARGAPQIAMDDDPVGRGKLGNRRGQPLEDRMGVADIARQHAAAGSGADGFRVHQQRWRAQRHVALRLVDLSLDPARRVVRPPLRLLIGIGHPRIAGLATAPVDRDGEGAEFGDVVVAALGWLVAQGEIGLAAHEVRRRLEKLQGDAGRQWRRRRSRQATGQEAGGTFAGRYPHRATQRRRGRRAPPLERQHGLLGPFGCRDQPFADGAEVRP